MDYDKLIAKKCKDMKPSGIRKFFDIAAQMDNVILISRHPGMSVRQPLRLLKRARPNTPLTQVLLSCVRLSAGTYIKTQAWIMTLRVR